MTKNHCIYHNMFTLALVYVLHIGIIRRECNRNFLAITCFTGVFSDLCLFVGHRGLKLQNQMEFREIFRSMMLQTNLFWELY